MGLPRCNCNARAARRPIPHSIVLTRWKARGLSERATLDSLQEAGLPILMNTLSDTAEYSKMTFSGAVATSGKVKAQTDSLLEEIRGKGVIPPTPAREPRDQAA